MNDCQTAEQCDLSKTHEHSATACGKAIIVGEHSVVYGTRAVAMPLPNMRFQFSLLQLPTADGKAPQVQLKLSGHDISPRVQAVVTDAMKLLDIPSFSLLGRSQTTIPIGAGLGSSATLCVAVLRALAASRGIDLSADRLARLANELEKSFHGNPSGLDAAVVAYEQCILFAKGQGAQPIDANLTLSRGKFVLLDSGLRASTLAMIRLAEPFFMGPTGERQLQAFDELSLQVHRCMQEGDIKGIGSAMNACDTLLRQAQVVPDALAEMIDKMRSLGVVGVKSTGAGGGGMILCLLAPEQAQQQMQQIREYFPNHALYQA